MFKLLTVVFLTLFTMSSIAEDKYDFMVDKSLLCSPKEVIIKQMEEGKLGCSHKNRTTK